MTSAVLDRPPARPPMTDALTLALALIAAVLGVVLVVYPPDGSLVPAVFAFLWVAMSVASRWQERHSRRLLRMMRAAPRPEPPSASPSAGQGESLPPLEVETFDPDRLPPLSAAAGRLLATIRGCQDTQARSAWRGVWLLVVAAFLGTEASVIEILGKIFEGAFLFTVVARLALRSKRLTTIAVVAPVLIRWVWRILILLAIAGCLMHVRDRGPQMGLAIAVAALAIDVVDDRLGARRALRRAAPIRLVLLWVFDSPGLGRVMAGVMAPWMWLGNMTSLGGDVGPTPRAFRHGQAGEVVETDEELERALRTWHEPRRWKSIGCADVIWQLAVQKLFDLGDLVLMDLRGFSPTSPGCVWEIDQLIDRFPTDRFLLLTDDSTDRTLLDQTLRQSWAAMPERSPNRRSTKSIIRVLDLGKSEGANAIGALEREANAVMAILCEMTVSAGLVEPMRAA